MDIHEIIEIIKCNPNKDIVKYGQDLNSRLEKCIIGCDLNSFFTQNKYFESDSIFKERKKTTSNKDLFGRIMQKESMVFSARGGSCIYDGIAEQQQKELNAYLDNIYLGMNLRQWISSFANKAYEVDPMGVIFIEKDEEGNPYPTYKSIKSIYDYEGSGQSLEYVCFNLTNKEAEEFDIPDEKLEKIAKSNPNDKSNYFRFVDEEKDYIFLKDNKTISLVEWREKDIEKEVEGVEEPLIPMTIEHKFKSCPAFIISDIPNFQNNNQYLSKLDNVIELAECYQNDRSVRDLSKKFHGFPKLVQPVVKCKECTDGYIGGVVCSSCKGTGRKQITTVSDTIEIPLEMLAQNTSLDIKKIFVYVTPDIETWNKQDNSLSDLENLINDCYWGTDNRKYTTGANLHANLQETATKTMTNLQPVYARLERTADWAESIERRIVNFIGVTKFPTSFKNSSIKYGRDYILESTETIYSQYLDFKTKGSPQYILNDYLDMYLRSKYQNNPIELSVALKLIEVEPFIHYTALECIALNLDSETMKQKIYFPEWYNSVKNDYLFASTTEQLRKDLIAFVASKTLKENTQIGN